MITYTNCTGFSTSLQERQDCAVIAVAVATQTPYLEVNRLFTSFGRQYRWPTSFSITLKVLNYLGFTTEFPSGDWFLTKREFYNKHGFIEPFQKNLRRFTPISLERAADKESIYLVKTKGHIYTLYKGSTECYVYGTRKRVLWLTKVVKSHNEDIL
jgi:hypothetical protein